MGYRPTICCLEDSWEFGKFYGYVKLDGLKSIKWLVDHGKLDGDPETEFLGGWGPEICFTADEFREFIDLYQEDINNYDWNGKTTCGIKYDSAPHYKMSDLWPYFTSVYKNNSYKIIYWG